MTETSDSAKRKEWDEVNLKALSNTIADNLKEQLGGDFEVSLTKLEHSGSSEESLLQFGVRRGIDTSGWER